MSKTIVSLIIGGIVGLIVMFSTVSIISTRNSQAVLRNRMIQTQEQLKQDYDVVWKTIKEQGNLKDSYYEKFKEVYVESAKARYEKGGDMFKFIQESNPALSDTVVLKVMNTVEVKRVEFAEKERLLRDLKVQDDRYFTTFPASLFMWNRQPFEIRTVRSTRTDNSFSTGKDDELIK